MSVMAANQEQFGPELRALVPINSLAPAHQDQILAQAATIELAPGEFVFREGERDGFTYYLLTGRLHLLANGQHLKIIAGGSEDAVHPLAQLQPRKLTAQVAERAVVLRVDHALVDRLLAMSGMTDQPAGMEVVEFDCDDDGDWMTRMLQSALFMRVPAANIQRIFTRMEYIEVKAGDEIIRQGGPGDYYYVIQSGRCEVLRGGARGRKIRLAELVPGDSFGEEALVANSRRNASVTMLTDGELRRLTKDDFIELIKKPMFNEIDYQQAKARVARGAIWLDVRFPDEFAKASFPGASNLPLNLLRTRVEQLNDECSYVTCCDSGTRSAVAAFLLAERGFDVYHLQGGFDAYGLLAESGTPSDAVVSPATPPKYTPVAESPAGARVGDAEVLPFPPNTLASAQAAPPVLALEEGDGRELHESTLDADVRAQLLKADLAKAALQLEQAQRLKEEAEAARREAEAAAERRIEAERDALAAQVRAEAEARQRQNDEAAAAIAAERARLAAEAERVAAEHAAAEQALAARFEAERAVAEQALEVERARLAEEAERIAAERVAAEQALVAEMAAERASVKQSLDLERARLADGAAQVQADRAAAEQELTARINAERAYLAEEAARIAAEHAATEQALAARFEAERAAAERTLEAERTRLADEAARISVERAAAEQALTAKRDAERIIVERDLAEQLNVERERLAQDAERARRTWEEACKLKLELEVARQEAELEAERRHAAHEERIQQMQAQAEARLQEEQRRLEQSYAWQAEELAKLQQLKETAEARLAEERARAIEQSEHARQRLAEARRIQREVEVTQSAAQQEAEQRHVRQLELERRLREEIREKIHSERQRLETEFARNAEELERARRERDAAEAARVAAAAEAEQIIAEQRAAYEKLRQQEQQELTAERQLLAAEAAHLRDALHDSQRDKDAALDAQRAAEQQLVSLREQQAQAATERGASAIASIEQDVARARARVVAAERAQSAVKTAHAKTLASMQRNEQASEAAKVRLEEELNEWLREQESHGGTLPLPDDQREYLERIRTRAKEARDRAKQHDQALLDELELQLRGKD